MIIDWIKSETLLIKIIREAGDAVLEEYNKESDYQIKDDNSPLTKADLISHKIILKGLTEFFPQFPILSEESSENFILDNPDKTFWCVDPVDGTKEFIERNGEFTINISLISKMEPILGLVLIPASNILYTAFKSMGAFKIIEEKKEKITVKKSLNQLTFAVSKSHINNKTKLFISQFKKNSLKSVGSSIKLCLVAEGIVDCYPRMGPTSLWDIAAGHCIVNEAGGFIKDEEGNVLTYDVSRSYLNKNFIAQSAAFLKMYEDDINKYYLNNY